MAVSDMDFRQFSRVFKGQGVSLVGLLNHGNVKYMDNHGHLYYLSKQ